MEVIKMKNRIKYLTLFTIMFIFSACSGLFKFKPYFITFVYSHGVYGILENEKVNRMGVPKNNIDKRIDPRTFEEQGREELPQVHLGTASYQMEKKGIQAERGNQNRKIIALNTELKKLKEEI